ncbi:MAG: MBL fold metallo-hydrolase [Candidatus Bathyarchaeota archaeon]
MIRFDPTTKRNHGNAYTFISHAHGDHIGGLNPDEKIYLTAETKDILFKRNSVEEFENLIPLRYGGTVPIDGLDISIHNSGHILGSAQYEIRDSTSTIVYTGDINCRETLTTTAAEAIPCDTLILETTYGNPFYNFPSLTKIHASIISWAIEEIQKKRTPTFTVYPTGKAQEIVKIFNEFTSIPVVTSHLVAKVNEAYYKNGVKLRYQDSTSEDGKELLKQPCVQVISPSEKSFVLGRCSFATTTGWALRSGIKISADATFPLSGHADFKQLVNYVEHAKPKELFTVHGFKKDFASYISRKLGIRARELPPLKQSNLRTFM